MDQLLHLDEESRIATFQPGLRGPHAEALLRERGYTLGHFPQSYAYATLGGYVATRSAGQASTGYGRIDDLVVGARLRDARGRAARGPRRRQRRRTGPAGPGHRQRGDARGAHRGRLRVRPAPEVELHEAWVAPSFASGAATLRALVQAGVAPTITRLSDEDETATALAQQRGLKTAALRRYLGLRGIDRPAW
jgi:alkyldihydroxyacetonephosphate synthase